MAQQRNQPDVKKFSCSICLDLLKDPVTTSCGHSYCMDCIKTHWDGEDGKRIYSCPQCGKIFTPRPVLEKHVLLAELVEDLKKTGLQAAADDHCYAGPEDVACDVCTGRKRKAVKSCLGCLISYCDNHLQPHYDVAQLKKHQLVEPSKNLQENVCSRHDEVMKIFCLIDQQLICYLCTMDEHKGHETVPAAAERKKKQKELEVSRLNIQQRIQDRQKDVELLQQELEVINVAAHKTEEDSEKVLTQMIHLIKERLSDVEQQIRSQQETEVSRVKELQEKLKQEIRDLKRKDAELKQLSDTLDDTHFLLNYPSVSALSESTHSFSINIRPLRHFEDVTAAVKELRDQLQDLLRDTWTNISLAITEVDVLLSEPRPELEPEPEPEPEPETRAGFLKYSKEITLDPNTAKTHTLLTEGKRKVSFMESPHSLSDVLLSGPQAQAEARAGFTKFSRQITLDPNTANRQLLLSEGNRKVTFVQKEQRYPDHPERFTYFRQVLSKESLTGCCYWEVEWRGRGIYVAVASKNIRRTGNSIECGFGQNDKSWTLLCDTHSYKFCYNNTETPVSGPRSSRIGVYLDHRAGILSFYSVSKTITLLHIVQTTFTEPIHAGVWVFYGTTAEFLKLK